MALTERADQEIAEEVITELIWELGAAGGIHVDVLCGVPVLSGRVATTDERRRAVAATHRVRGVLDVVNAIGVVVSGTPAADDLVLLHSVRRALEWDSFAPDERIDATVANGWVTLRGVVDHAADVADADRAVRQIMGVRGVKNLLEVGWSGATSSRMAVEAHA